MKEFNSIAAFIAHMERAALATVVAEHSGVAKGAEMIRDEARAEIGHYQEAAGQFEAWQALTEHTQDDRVRKGFSPDDPLLRTGDLRDSITCTARGHEAAIGSNSDIAIWQELGTNRIPPRSFLGGAAFRKSKAVIEQIGSRVVWALRGLSPGTS